MIVAVPYDVKMDGDVNNNGDDQRKKLENRGKLFHEHRQQSSFFF